MGEVVKTVGRDAKCSFSAWPGARCPTGGMLGAVGTESCPSRLHKGLQHNFGFLPLPQLLPKQMAPNEERTILGAVSWASAGVKTSPLLSSLCWGGRAGGLAGGFTWNSLCEAEMGCAPMDRKVMRLLALVELRSPEKCNSTKWKRS